MAELTPVMAQYVSIKEQHPNEILFFRLGDFYEMFYEEAVEVSRLLNLTLTHRTDAPMCGIPYHASKIYIARLLRLGKKIAICEQIGDPKAKGLTERKVVEIITPGNVTEEEYLENGVNNFLASICFVQPPSTNKGNQAEKQVSYSYIDVSTGNFYATHWSFLAFKQTFLSELARVTPRELVCSQSVYDDSDFSQIIEQYPNLSVSSYADWHFSMELCEKSLLNQFGTVTLKSFSIGKNSPEIPSSGFLLEYIHKNCGLAENAVLKHVTNLNVYADNQFLMIDDSSRRNLEITANLHDGTDKFSLLETVSFTCTPMGRRLLSSWFMYPLTDQEKICNRLNHVELFVKNPLGLNKIRENLSKIYDIERLAGRISLEKAHPKDLQTLRFSLDNAVETQNILSDFDFPSIETETAQKISSMISNALMDNPSVLLNDGNIIKSGYSEELDHWRNVHDNFSTILDEYLEEEKNATGIQNLKIRYTNVMGYYIEVTKGKLSDVPSHFILRRSLVNGERYTTEKLQKLENELMNASEKILVLERQLFLELRNQVAQYLDYLFKFASIISYVDVVASLAYAAQRNSWVRPQISGDETFEVEGGRHPVVELHLPSGEFIPNSVNLSQKEFALITGPNMAGKSTFLRQNALITFLAQIGSFVPATSAKIGIADRIFCRVGASDNLARGESTFLVEMSETALILRSATKRSLVIMDEVGRGTSTEDGLSLAWAISEYLLNKIQCRTLFATHYHQLTRLNHDFLQNLCMDVIDDNGKIIFLRKVKEGSAQNSYGLHVALLAGVPKDVVDRAKQILDSSGIVSSSSSCNSSSVQVPVQSYSAPSLFSEEEMVLDSILSSDVNAMTPLEALSKIAEWKRQLLS